MINGTFFHSIYTSIMVKLKKEIVFLYLFCIFIFVKNVTPLEENCSEVAAESRNDEDFAILSRVKRSFGGPEPINFTLINTNVLGPPGWLPLASGATMDLIFRVSGYTVLGMCNALTSHVLYECFTVLQLLGIYHCRPFLSGIHHFGPFFFFYNFFKHIFEHINTTLSSLFWKIKKCRSEEEMQ